ncbi:translin [Sitodiplosis mosellana]|uniref:translin n=1 Tax=Sitodiplosis mosellana TaxID=263140 RepID=UPI002443F6CC|nr:translin [Sitodiplosis mosellana]
MARVPKELFTQFQDQLNNEQEVRDEIRAIMKEIDVAVRDATLSLQVIHTSLTEVSGGCLKAREQFEVCCNLYEKLAKLVPSGQYYRYNDHWSWTTQRLVFLIALTIFLEKGFLVERDTAAEILGLKTKQRDGFHLDIEDYLMGVLQLASELSRFATNAVTLGDYERPLQISRFLADLSAGFRLLNLKNDGLRKRFDGLKYDVKKIEEIVYDISIRRLRPTEADQANTAQPAE